MSSVLGIDQTLLYALLYSLWLIEKGSSIPNLPLSKKVSTNLGEVFAEGVGHFVEAHHLELLLNHCHIVRVILRVVL